MEKMTYVKALEVAIEKVEEGEVRDKLVALKKVYEDRKTNKKPTKTQKENEGLKDEILEILVTADKAMTVTEILATKVLPEEVVNQKVTALLRQLIAEGRVEKVVDKKKSYFRAVDEEEEGVIN